MVKWEKPIDDRFIKAVKNYREIFKWEKRYFLFEKERGYAPYGLACSDNIKDFQEYEEDKRFVYDSLENKVISLEELKKAD